MARRGGRAPSVAGVGDAGGPLIVFHDGRTKRDARSSIGRRFAAVAVRAVTGGPDPALGAENRTSFIAGVNLVPGNEETLAPRVMQSGCSCRDPVSGHTYRDEYR